MLQQPCVLQDVFAVTGGGINLQAENLPSGSRHAWIITPTLVDGKSFGDIYNGNWYCRKYVGNEFAMVEHMRDLRNTRVHELMQELSAAADPNQTNVLTSPP